MSFIRTVTRFLLTVFIATIGAFELQASQSDMEDDDRSVIRDVAYGSSPRQRLDVYLPDRPHDAPILVMVHGGGWAMGSKSSRSVVHNKMQHWLPKGYIFVSVGYRLIPEANPLEQADDIAEALAMVQKKAASWGGDPLKIVLMGHSAGGHLVALLTADDAIAKKAGAKSWLATISIDSAALNVSTIMNNGRPALYRNAFGDDPKFWAKASPTLRLSSPVPPMLMVCSSLRRITCNQAREFAKKAGENVQVLPVALRHMPINEKLGANNRYTRDVDAFLKSVGLP